MLKNRPDSLSSKTMFLFFVFCFFFLISHYIVSIIGMGGVVTGSGGEVGVAVIFHCFFFSPAAPYYDGPFARAAKG